MKIYRILFMMSMALPVLASTQGPYNTPLPPTPEMQKKFDEFDGYMKEVKLAKEKSDYLKALEYCEKALRVFPDDAKALSALGDIQDKIGNYEESYKAYHRIIFDKRLISTYATDVIILDRYASVCEKLGNEKEAYEGWQMILDYGKKAYMDEFLRHISKPLQPNEVKACAKLLVSLEYAATGKDSIAEQFSRSAVGLLPNFAPTNYYHALHLKYVRKYKESLQFFKKTLNLCKNDKALRDKAESHIKDVEYAIRYHEKEAAKKRR